MKKKETLIDAGWGIKNKKGLVLRGDFTYSDGSTYSGSVKSLQKKIPHGYGTFRYIDGKVYSGGWKNNQYHGYGTLIQPEGNKSHFDSFKYIGQFKNNKMHGKGKMLSLIHI